HQTVEKPPQRTELGLVLELLKDARSGVAGLEPRHPAHEPDRPVALGHFEPQRAPVLPMCDALDDAPLRHELARAGRADAGPLRAHRRGAAHARVVVRHLLQIGEYFPDDFGWARGVDFMSDRGHGVSTSEYLWSSNGGDGTQ